MVGDRTVVRRDDLESRLESRIRGPTLLDWTVDLEAASARLERVADDGSDIFVVGMDRRKRNQQARRVGLVAEPGVEFPCEPRLVGVRKGDGGSDARRAKDGFDRRPGHRV